MVEDGLLKDTKFILGEYLNITLSTREVWGSELRLDPLAPHLNQIFQSYSLIDVLPISIPSIWRNGMMGGKGVAKIWDSFSYLNIYL